MEREDAAEEELRGMSSGWSEGCTGEGPRGLRRVREAKSERTQWATVKIWELLPREKALKRGTAVSRLEF